MDLFTTPLLAIPLLAFAVSVLLHAASLTVFPRWGLLDFPARYGLTRSPIPYPTGILSIVAFVALFLSLQPLQPQTIGILAAIVLLGACCVIDDRRPLPPLLRIGVHAGIAIVLVACGVRVEAITNPLPWFIEGGRTLQLHTGLFFAFSVLFTVVWLLVTINALNWFDGIPGQVSVLSTIAFLTIGLLALSDRVQQPALALLAFVLAGIAASAALFDFPPPRVLMGDTGAMFLGLMIGVLTIYSGGKVATAFLVLGIPLIDMLFVVIRRLRRGQSPLRGNASDQHLHHRLLQKGWTPRQVIFFTAVIGTGFGVTALFLDTAGKVIASGVLFAVMMGMSVYSEPREGVR